MIDCLTVCGLFGVQWYDLKWYFVNCLKCVMILAFLSNENFMSYYERMIHAILYEITSVVFAGVVLFFLTDYSAGAVSSTMLGIITVSMLWNMLFNWLFDRIATGKREQRKVLTRMIHAILFEGGLVLLTTPIIAYVLQVSLWEAFVMDLGITFAVVVYTYVFNWVYDHVRLYFVVGSVNPVMQKH